MTPFVKAMLDAVIKREGGYVNRKEDAGGPTNMGVTIADLKDMYGHPVTIDDLKKLTVDQAEEFYDRTYYVFPRFDTLAEVLQPDVVDAGVLYGTKRATMFLQQIVNEAGFGTLDVDGVMGPQTRAKIAEAYAKMGPYFVNALVEERIMYNSIIVKNKPQNIVFLDGWNNRANMFRVKV